MQKILLPILSAIFSLTSLLRIEQVSAQIAIDSYPEQDIVEQNHSQKLTTQKWLKLVKLYYRTRYRKQFEENNSFLSLKEVNNLLGFAGKRAKFIKNSSHQYWYWKDENDPHKRIEGIFVYHQLVGLRTRGFDRQVLQELKTSYSLTGDR